MSASGTSASGGPLGLLGGTFDPIHIGHLRLAQEVLEALELHSVCLIPAGQPPHRDLPRATAAQRLAMTALAIAGNPRLTLDDQEARSPDPSYTVTTLERLRRAHGAQRPLVLILGADAFAGLARWHRWEALFDLAHLAVANRPGHPPHGRQWPATLSPELDAVCRPRIASDPTALRQQPAGCILPFDMTPLAISATHIRDLLAQQHSPRYLLPDPVLDYIDQHRLYRPKNG